MSNNSKILASIIAIAGAAAAVTLLLNTKSGKKVLAEVKTAAEKTLRKWKNVATNAIEEAETAV